MDIQTAQALAKLSDDELKTLFVQRFPILDKSTIVATRDQIISALLKYRIAA